MPKSGMSAAQLTASDRRLPPIGAPIKSFRLRLHMHIIRAGSEAHLRQAVAGRELEVRADLDLLNVTCQ